jgi:hypothetical protein
MFLIEVLGRCSIVEQRIAEIYRQFENGWTEEPEWGRFWQGMGAEEQQHATLLLAEQAAFEEDIDISYFLPMFPTKLAQIETVLKRIEEQGRRDVSKEEAFDLALQIEQVELDILYRDLTALGRTTVKLKAQRLDDPFVVPSHQQSLLAGVMRFLLPGAVRDKVEVWARKSLRVSKPKH